MIIDTESCRKPEEDFWHTEWEIIRNIKRYLGCAFKLNVNSNTHRLRNLPLLVDPNLSSDPHRRVSGWLAVLCWQNEVEKIEAIVHAGGKKLPQTKVILDLTEQATLIS